MLNEEAIKYILDALSKATVLHDIGFIDEEFVRLIINAYEDYPHKHPYNPDMVKKIKEAADSKPVFSGNKKEFDEYLDDLSPQHTEVCPRCGEEGIDHHTGCPI